MTMDEHLQADHDRIYARIGLPPWEADWITDRVLAGRNCLSALDVNRLVTEYGITHVLDLREPQEWCAPKAGQDALDEIERGDVSRRHIPITDFGAPSMEALDQAVAFIDEALSQAGARVFVHCRAGLERTAAVLIAWYATAHGVDYDAAFQQLRRGRPVLRPLREQEQVVRRWLERVRTARAPDDTNKQV